MDFGKALLYTLFFGSRREQFHEVEESYVTMTGARVRRNGFEAGTMKAMVRPLDDGTSNPRVPSFLMKRTWSNRRLTNHGG